MVMKPGSTYRTVIRLAARLSGQAGEGIGAGVVGAATVATAATFGVVKGAIGAVSALLSKRKP